MKLFSKTAVAVTIASFALVGSAFATDPASSSSGTATTAPTTPAGTFETFYVGAAGGYEGWGGSSDSVNAYFDKVSGANSNVNVAHEGNACGAPDCGNTTFTANVGAYEGVTGSFTSDGLEGWTGSTANAGGTIDINGDTYSAGGAAAGNTAFAGIGDSSSASGESYTGVSTTLSASGCGGCQDVMVKVEATDSRSLQHVVSGANGVYNKGNVSSGASVTNGGNH